MKIRKSILTFLLFMICFVFTERYVMAEEIILDNNSANEQTEASDADETFNVVSNDEISDSGDNSDEFMNDENNNDKTNDDNGMEEEVPNKLEEIDLGDYREKMVVGERQLLIATPIPQTIEKKFIYSSSDKIVARINGLGRITALSPGETLISVECDQVKEEFVLEVIWPEEEKVIEVEAIEVRNYEKEMYVDDIQNLTVAFFPQNALNTDIVFSSADENIVAVNSFGEVKALSKGETEVLVSIGDVTERIPILVKVKTEDIHLNKSVIFMNPNETYVIKAKVFPNEAEQILTYKSSDNNVIEVFGNKVTAKSIGEASVIISNGEISNSVVVIVNEQYSNVTEIRNELPDLKKSVLRQIENEILVSLEKEDIVNVDIDLYPIVSKNMLRELYNQKKTLILKTEEYSIQIEGENIINLERAFYAILDVVTTEDGVNIDIDDPLPGKITFNLNKERKFTYVFLYDKSTEKYEKLKINGPNNIDIDLQGKYFFTDHDIEKSIFNEKFVYGSVFIFIIGLILLVFMKRKYWFW